MSLICINIGDVVLSESAAKFKVKDGVLYVPDSAKAALNRREAKMGV